MIVEQSTQKRLLKKITIQSDLAIIGGGLAGVCSPITAARAGLKVSLVQDMRSTQTCIARICVFTQKNYSRRFGC